MAACTGSIEVPIAMASLVDELESERRELVVELERAHERVTELQREVLDADAALDRLEEEGARTQSSRKLLDARRVRLEARQARLWERLVELQNERDAVKRAEEELERERSRLSAEEARAAEGLRSADEERRRLEEALAHAHRHRREITGELASIEAELARTKGRSGDDDGAARDRGDVAKTEPARREGEPPIALRVVAEG